MFYPIQAPFATHHISVDDPHILHVEERGNPKGIPVVCLHGGPGATSNPDIQRFFDPVRYRIITFDQRGCGRSTPTRCLVHQTPQSLVKDIEHIRKTLRIKRWVVMGSSFGSLLAILYAAKYRKYVTALLLRSVCLGRTAQMRFGISPAGLHWLFPHAWRSFMEGLQGLNKKNVLEVYQQLVNDENLNISIKAARAWCAWEQTLSSTQIIEESECPSPTPESDNFLLTLATLQLHYFGQGLIRPAQVMRAAKKLTDIPGAIVHGRYDLICPIDNAYDLLVVWSNAKFYPVVGAGHSGRDPGMEGTFLKAIVELEREVLCVSQLA